MDSVRELIKRVAPVRLAVLIRGESGVGKGFVASTIHKLSERTGGFFVLNCGEHSADQTEIELFGCEHRDLTRATEAKAGLLEAAKAGTVFLDDVGKLPAGLQDKLLRTIESGNVVRLGATRPRPIDVRFISATNQDMDRAVQDGTFHRHLFFRLNGITVEISPLRQRTDEIPRLVDTFIKDFCRESDRGQVPHVTPDAMKLLLAYPWPGNVDELKKVIERALRLWDKPEISAEHLTIEMRATARASATDQDPGPKCSLCGRLEKETRELISGPRVFICDECVEEAQTTIYAAADHDAPSAGPEEVTVPGDLEVSCAFCGKRSFEVRHVVGGEEASICDECLNLCDDILGERFSGKWPLGICEAKPLKKLRLIDRYWMNFPSVSATDVGVMSPEEAVSRARAAKMILRLNRRQDEVPVYSLVDADDEHTEDDPMVIPRKTFTLRTMYPAGMIEARILQAHDELRRDNPCRIVILVEDGQTDPARLLLARLETALIAVAEIREYPAARRPRALTAIAIPRSPEQAIQ